MATRMHVASRPLSALRSPPKPLLKTWKPPSFERIDDDHNCHHDDDSHDKDNDNHNCHDNDYGNDNDNDSCSEGKEASQL